jgi:hypothetical protein
VAAVLLCFTFFAILVYDPIKQQASPAGTPARVANKNQV